MTPEEVMEKAGNNLIVCNDLDDLHHRFAIDIASEIKSNNLKKKQTKLILPVGPIGQYPILTEIIKKENIPLPNCWFFFMDEYCDENGVNFSEHHPLGFKRIAKSLFLDHISDFNLIPNQVIFPDENNIRKLTSVIKRIGGIDTCYGGIGIHGHVAFNEPKFNIVKTNPRKVKLNKYTITINAIRSQIGGNLECFPKRAYTLGMKQILNSRRIRLYCRNGIPFDWANTILRIALFGSPGNDYPVTYIRNHADYKIITDKDTISTPKILL
jgi:glucosamine-6-phosphate deaminase